MPIIIMIIIILLMMVGCFGDEFDDYDGNADDNLAPAKERRQCDKYKPPANLCLYNHFLAFKEKVLKGMGHCEVIQG